MVLGMGARERVAILINRQAERRRETGVQATIVVALTTHQGPASIDEAKEERITLCSSCQSFRWNSSISIKGLIAHAVTET